MPASGYLCDFVSWQSVFYVFGALGVLWFVAWCFLVYDGPEVHPMISEGEKAFIQVDSSLCEQEINLSYLKVVFD